MIVLFRWHKLVAVVKGGLRRALCSTFGVIRRPKVAVVKGGLRRDTRQSDTQLDFCDLQSLLSNRLPAFGPLVPSLAPIIIRHSIPINIHHIRPLFLCTPLSQSGIHSLPVIVVVYLGILEIRGTFISF